MKEHDWIGAFITMTVTNGQPRAFSVLGLTAEIRTIRALADALFGWLP